MLINHTATTQLEDVYNFLVLQYPLTPRRTGAKMSTATMVKVQ